MLSTRISAAARLPAARFPAARLPDVRSGAARLRAAVLTLALAAVAACAAPGPRVAGNDGIAVDPNQPVKVALLLPYGTGDAGREQIARSLENAARLAQSELRDATVELTVYPTAGTTAGGSAAASQAVAEGAKIIVGPLFSTETAGAQGPASAAGLTVLSLSNNPSVAGGNVYVLGTTFENTADRLVAYGQSRGLNAFGVVYPEGLEGESARDAVRAAATRRGASVVAAESYNLSVEGIQAAGPAVAAALNGAGANAVVLTDGPTGGLAFIAEAMRGNGVGQAQFLGMQRWDTSAETLAVPSLQGGVFAAPDPALPRRLPRPLPDHLRRGAARARRPRLRRDRRGRRAHRRGPRPGRQPVLDRAAHPGRGLRRRQRSLPPDGERGRATQPRDHRRPERPGGGDGKGGAFV